MDAVTVGGFQLANLLLAFIVSSTFIFVLYWLWTCPCKDHDKENELGNPRKYTTLLPERVGTPVATLYAMEIEPGTVVLQSEDGEFFRILREYDKVERTGYGSVSREMANCSAANQYVPSYTRAHYQTKPSAPPSHLTEEDQWRSRYDPYGYMETWRPLQTINGATY
ncbi:hypothetical protein RRG08_060842 [Elysia crispata]|uniref:Uncharacterized protein n=1 Tax=Elysia crispata TaxID=231223 RepID=A0AAE1DG01_9GAST|nr:hypothetical protein RRG08_060842 [Elysia crispata]